MRGLAITSTGRTVFTIGPTPLSLQSLLDIPSEAGAGSLGRTGTRPFLERVFREIEQQPLKRTNVAVFYGAPERRALIRNHSVQQNFINKLVTQDSRFELLNAATGKFLNRTDARREDSAAVTLTVHGQPTMLFHSWGASFGNMSLVSSHSSSIVLLGTVFSCDTQRGTATNAQDVPCLRRNPMRLLE